MQVKKNITGIILAGGKSTRMGSDKGFVCYKNIPFIEHIIAVLKPFVAEIIIVSNNAAYDVFKQKRVNDLIENSGPLAGLYSGLHHSKTENNLVLSCDIPLINNAVLEVLVAQKNTDIDVVMVESEGKTMPLIALYKKHCMYTFKKLLEQDERRMRFAVNQLKSKTIILENNLEKYTANINTKEGINFLNTI
ncbi:MAG: molybdenum cofactor guanylyltransferase [Cellulophaga sp.]